MRTLAHVTHEAVHKVGGIGAVLQGLLTSTSFQEAQYRNILIGPWFTSGGGAAAALGSCGEVLYSSKDRSQRHHPASDVLDEIHRIYNVDIIYGHRTFIDPHSGARVSPEIVLIDVEHMDPQMVNAFKGRLWQGFGIDSRRYETSWEYELYVKLADPALAVLRALGAADHDDQCVILAHEFMGMPTAMAGMMDPSGVFGSVFYAHEVATMRRIVEDHSGHDVTFYNVLSSALAKKRYVADVFGDQSDYYRHALVNATNECDCIFAVGHYVARELQFMSPDFADANIAITYNGIPSEKITWEQKQQSRERMRDYAEKLLGDRPDYIFSHVTRTAVSKGLWRDLRVLDALERQFRRENKTGVLFVLSTELPPRSSIEVRTMERSHHWPLAHREGGSDLSWGEARFYQGVQAFNARARNIKVLFVNQFGWGPEVCGDAMPPEMEMLDIRRGTDVEFGQSVYEPFGIAQLEALTFGGICVVSGVCGCAGFVDKVTSADPSANVIIAGYENLGVWKHNEKELLELTREMRDLHEVKIAGQVAQQLMQRLPRDDAGFQALLSSGYALARHMSWEVVAADHVLPELDAICSRLRKLRIA